MITKATTADAYRLLHHGSLELARVEANGFRLDVDYLDRVTLETKAKIKQVKEELEQSDVAKTWRRAYGAKTNYGSPQQFAHVFYDIMGYECKELTTKTKRPKTDQAALDRIDHPFARLRSRLGKLNTTMSTYLIGWRREGVKGPDGLWYVHPSMNLHINITYRSSCDNPNMQNIPVRIPELAEITRRCFIPRPGHRLGDADFKSVEVVVGCAYHFDPTMMHYLEVGHDYHLDFAMKVYLLNKDEVSKDARYCNPHESPIWMADGSFSKLGEIKIGDRVMGWEYSNNRDQGRGTTRTRGNRNFKSDRKRLVPATVEQVHKKWDKIVKVTFASGRTLRCTADHLWVSGKTQRRLDGSVAYVTPEVGRVLCHVVDPVEPPTSQKDQRKAAWLAGIYDGEGCWPNIAQSQDHNPEVCKEIENCLDRFGFEYKTGRQKSDSKCDDNYRINGGIQAEVNFLNICKPIRNKRIMSQMTGRSSFFKRDGIVSVEPDGEGWVYGMTTTTGNYVAWGYASKNCAKNKFVFPQFYGSVHFQCAPNLWEAIDILKLKVKGTEVSLREHLARKGIKELGECDPKKIQEAGGTKKGTFVHLVKQVEEVMWQETFPEYTRAKKRWWQEYLHRGYFDMHTGFRCAGIMDRNDVLNYRVQGAAFHCLLWCLIEINKELRRRKMRSRVVNQVHDSIVGDIHCNEYEDYLSIVHDITTRRLPQAYQWINVPIGIEMEVCEPGASWFTKQAIEFPLAH